MRDTRHNKSPIVEPSLETSLLHSARTTRLPSYVLEIDDAITDNRHRYMTGESGTNEKNHDKVLSVTLHTLEKRQCDGQVFGNILFFLPFTDALNFSLAAPAIATTAITHFFATASFETINITPMLFFAICNALQNKQTSIIVDEELLASSSSRLNKIARLFYLCPRIPNKKLQLTQPNNELMNLPAACRGEYRLNPESVLSYMQSSTDIQDFLHAHSQPWYKEPRFIAGVTFLSVTSAAVFYLYGIVLKPSSPTYTISGFNLAGTKNESTSFISDPLNISSVFNISSDINTTFSCVGWNTTNSLPAIFNFTYHHLNITKHLLEICAAKCLARLSGNYTFNQTGQIPYHGSTIYDDIQMERTANYNQLIQDAKNELRKNGTWQQVYDQAYSRVYNQASIQPYDPNLWQRAYNQTYGTLSSVLEENANDKSEYRYCYDGPADVAAMACCIMNYLDSIYPKFNCGSLDDAFRVVYDILTTCVGTTPPHQKNVTPSEILCLMQRVSQTTADCANNQQLQQIAQQTTDSVNLAKNSAIYAANQTIVQIAQQIANASLPLITYRHTNYTLVDLAKLPREQINALFLAYFFSSEILALEYTCNAHHQKDMRDFMLVPCVMVMSILLLNNVRAIYQQFGMPQCAHTLASNVRRGFNGSINFFRDLFARKETSAPSTMQDFNEHLTDTANYSRTYAGEAGIRA